MSFTDPYQQTTSYDVWNHSSRTGYLYGGGPFGDDGAYVNNRHHEWYYDADGNVTNSLTYHNTIDAAGKQAQVVSGIQTVGNDTTQFPTQPAIDITQGYDGDGRPRQRTQVMRQNIYDDTDENHPLIQVLEDIQASYYVTSSVLGGAKIMELRPNGEGGAIKKTLWIYAGGQRIAVEENGSVSFEHHNPATGSWVATLGHSSYRTATRQERDPVGAETPTSNPYPLTPTYAENKWGEPLFIDGGDPFDYSSGQSVDGMPMSEAQLAHMMDTGAVVGGLSKGGHDLGSLDFSGHGAMGMAYLSGQFGSIRIGTLVKDNNGEIKTGDGADGDIVKVYTNEEYGSHWEYSFVNASFGGGRSPQNSAGQQLSPCLRDALRQYFPSMTVTGNGSYSPVDDARFKAGIPSIITEAAKYTPGAVTPDAITLGLYDIYYNSDDVSIDGGKLHSLETVIEETSHTVQFLQVWDDLKQHRLKNFIERGNVTTGYGDAQSAWAQNYMYYSAKGLGYDNEVEKWAKDRVQSIVTDLRRGGQSQLCGFNLR